MPKKAIVSPLDWGWGHTTRCIPLVEQLQKQGFEIYIACNSEQRQVVENQLNNIFYLNLKGYNVRYRKKLLFFKLMCQIPKCLFTAFYESLKLKKWHKKFKFDLVVSDNRFGFFHRHVKSVYITHQTHLKSPFFERIIRKTHQRIIKQFDECWVPDFENRTLSGDLSLPIKGVKTKYIGTLSRFQKSIEPPSKPEFEYVAIISGAEPLRTEFEQKIHTFFLQIEKPCAIVQGSFKKPQKTTQNITYYPHLDKAKMFELISNCKGVLARSGYSSIMDFSVLKCPICLFPTKGQSEQIYLAEFLNQTQNIPFLSIDDEPLNWWEGEAISFGVIHKKAT